MNQSFLNLDGRSLNPLYMDTGDAQSFEAQSNYERAVVATARAIAAGEVDGPPTREHLRVLLNWLDGNDHSSTLDERPF